jgi:uncharacterized protein
LNPQYTPPWWLQSGLSMTLYTALRMSRHWEKYTIEPEPIYQEQIFSGDGDVPIFGIVAIPPNPKGTIVATYGITGTLENQWFLRILGRKAYAQGYAVVLFDWRAHGKTAELSPQLTSDGIHEGEDFVRIARQSLQLGCPAPMWVIGYSLGGQLALWGVKAGLDVPEIAGGAVICPSLESDRSLTYLMAHPLGKYLERAISKELRKLAGNLHQYHPTQIDPAAIDRATTIWGFDRELVIPRLGFATVRDYYAATSPLYFLADLHKPVLIIYAADDPLFDPTLVPELCAIASKQPQLDLLLTPHGGHVGHISSQACQTLNIDRDPWWSWNRILEWIQ